MNTQEEFEAILKEQPYPGSIQGIFELMQSAYNLAIKQAAEAATTKYVNSYGGYYEVDEQSILNLIIK